MRMILLPANNCSPVFITKVKVGAVPALGELGVADSNDAPGAVSVVVQPTWLGSETASLLVPNVNLTEVPPAGLVFSRAAGMAMPIALAAGTAQVPPTASAKVIVNWLTALVAPVAAQKVAPVSVTVTPVTETLKTLAGLGVMVMLLPVLKASPEV